MIFLLLFSLYVEQHYGCYRFGLIVAVIIIILLIVCAVVPIFLATDDAKVILMGVLIALFIVSILVFCYIGWEQRRAARQRLKARLQRDEMKDQEMVKCDWNSLLFDAWN